MAYGVYVYMCMNLYTIAFNNCFNERKMRWDDLSATIAWYFLSESPASGTAWLSASLRSAAAAAAAEQRRVGMMLAACSWCSISQIPLRYLVVDRFKAGSKLVADLQRAGIWPII